MALRLVLSVCALALLLDISSACLSSGVCGGGCGGGGFMPPPPPPVCGGGCSRGYSCGSYGCYRMRARARSSKTLSVDSRKKTQEELSKLSPDDKFMACCEERNLPDSCLPKCSYRTYTRDTLQSMYFKTDSCPMQAAADIHFCAAQGRDHRECCARNGVATTLAGAKCMTFCDQRPGNVTQLDMTYLACYERFENMKSCFWYDMTQGQGSELPPVSVPSDNAPNDETEVKENNDEETETLSHDFAPTRKFAPSARTFKGN